MTSDADRSGTHQKSTGGARELPAPSADAAGVGRIVPGTRACLSGFTRAEEEGVRSVLALRGVEVTPFLAGADLVVMPDGTPEEKLAKGREKGFLVLTPTALRVLLPPAARRTAVEVGPDQVRVLDVTLPRRPDRHRLVPDAGKFRHLCLDRPFLEAARAVALAARHGFPCMLEGETATSKTTATQWLAMLCRQPVMRLNLNGQSDTGELVGRYVPGEETSWRFHEGCIPRAMREGWWVVLDEVNLAEPQVLERLNSVLEDPPSLVLSEHDGRVFGPGGDEAVHPGFRVFGTMNPADYAGRSPLSPAFRDRFSLWTHVDSPGEAEYRQMLRRLVFGEQPEVALDGVSWCSDPAEPVHPGLARADGIGTLLDSIASFHAAVSAASGGQGAAASLGRSRRERYVFTRRNLLTALRLLEVAVADGQPAGEAAGRILQLVYGARVQDGGDRSAIRSALRAVSLLG
jgi:MoxR-like ATPase